MANRKKWTGIGGDVNWREHGGLWMRPLGDGEYEVLKFENLDETREPEEHRYSVISAHIDVKDARTPDIAKFIGEDLDGAEIDDATWIYGLVGYWGLQNYGGEYVTGNNARKLMRCHNAGSIQ